MRRSESIIAPVAVALAVALARQGCDDPTPPVPPNPPGPNPPVIVDPPPVTTSYRVLIIEETAARSTLKPEQLAILTSVPLRQWIEQQGAALRVLDQDADMQFSGEQWKAMMSKKGASLPWLVVTGKGEFSGPLPGTVAEVQALVGRYKP